MGARWCQAAVHDLVDVHVLAAHSSLHRQSRELFGRVPRSGLNAHSSVYECDCAWYKCFWCKESAGTRRSSLFRNAKRKLIPRAASQVVSKTPSFEVRSMHEANDAQVTCQPYLALFIVTCQPYRTLFIET